jgi:hypothetical protein
LAKIPQILHEHINTAFPAHVCTPRGSTMVFDEEHIALWERGRGTTTENLIDGTPVTIFMRNPALRAAGILPKGGILRLYGRAKIHKSGPERICGPRCDRESRGFVGSAADLTRRLPSQKLRRDSFSTAALFAALNRQRQGGHCS